MQRAKFFAPLIILGLILFAGSPAMAEHKAKAERLAMDNGFVATAAQGGMAEVELGKLAQTKATNPAVKQLADTIVADHTQANEELKQIMAKMNMAWPPEMSSKVQAEKEKLEKLSGAEFDKECVKMMIRDHKHDIRLFEREAKHAENPDVKNFASQALPKLRNHLQLAENAWSQLK